MTGLDRAAPQEKGFLVVPGASVVFCPKMNFGSIGATLMCALVCVVVIGQEEKLATDTSLPVGTPEEKSPIAAQPRDLPTPEETWTLVGGEALLGRIFKFDPKKKSVDFKEMTAAGTVVDRTFSLDEFSDRNQEFLNRYLTGEITGKVVDITDGDSLKIVTPAKKVFPIRLHGVDAPERGQAFSKKAKAKLSELTFGQTITIHIRKIGSFDRLVGTPYNEDDRNVCLELLKSGLAWYSEEHLQDYAEYATAEAAARSQRMGLWADHNSIAPWEYRKNRKIYQSTESLIERGRKIRVMEPRFSQLRQAATSQPETARFSGRVSLFTALTTAIWEAPKRLARYWMTENSKVRHNEYCPHFGQSKSGRLSGPNEGRPCKRCGG